MNRGFALGLLVAAACALPVAVMAAGGQPFDFDPVPRWDVPAGEDHDIADACPAIAKECPQYAPFEDIEARVTYDELYDADGMLAGIHITRSSGCKPLDEHLVLSQRHFRLAFRKDGQPDLDDMRMSLAPGVDRNSVRMIKTTEMGVSVGC